MLAEPAFGATTLALLASGEQLYPGPATKGFLSVQCASGQRGYVPAALCTPLAAGAPGREPPLASVMQPVALYRSPAPGNQFAARWIIAPEEPLRVLSRQDRFVHIQRPDGQVGYVPAVLCRDATVAHGAPPTVRLVQPVSLYGSPAPGSQFESRWIVAPSETLLLLGRDGRFALVQREDGQLGYVPAALVGQPVADALLPAGPVDLGWIAIGGVWGLVNWAGVAATLAQLFFLGAALQPYLGLGVVLGVAALLWLGSRRRVAARSLAIGMLLAYAFLHLASGGSATLWRQ